MESSNKEGESEEVEVGIHKNPFNLICILLCKPCKAKALVQPLQMRPSLWPRFTDQTAAESKRHPACGSKSEASRERWSRRKWTEEAPRKCCWSPAFIKDEGQMTVNQQRFIRSSKYLKCKPTTRSLTRLLSSSTNSRGRYTIFFPVWNLKHRFLWSSLDPHDQDKIKGIWSTDSFDLDPHDKNVPVFLSLALTLSGICVRHWEGNLGQTGSGHWRCLVSGGNASERLDGPARTWHRL